MDSTVTIKIYVLVEIKFYRPNLLTKPISFSVFTLTHCRIIPEFVHPQMR